MERLQRFLRTTQQGGGRRPGNHHLIRHRVGERHQVQVPQLARRQHGPVLPSFCLRTAGGMRRAEWCAQACWADAHP
eukprot:scaffold20944_cov56-Phaeocystis_antarctica.AAC.8